MFHLRARLVPHVLVSPHNAQAATIHSASLVQQAMALTLSVMPVCLFCAVTEYGLQPVSSVTMATLTTTTDATRPVMFKLTTTATLLICTRMAHLSVST